MKKFEYKEIRYDWKDLTTNELNKLGLKGWELVSVIQEMQGQGQGLRAMLIRYVFKREIIIMKMEQRDFKLKEYPTDFVKNIIDLVSNKEKELKEALKINSLCIQARDSDYMLSIHNTEDLEELIKQIKEYES